MEEEQTKEVSRVLDIGSDLTYKNKPNLTLKLLDPWLNATALNALEVYQQITHSQ